MLFIEILSKVYPTYFLRKKVEEDFTPMYFCSVNLSLSSLRCGIGVVLFFWNPPINSLFSRKWSEKSGVKLNAVKCTPLI